MPVLNTGLSDEEIVSRILDGEQEAFATLVRRYQGRILRLGWGFFRNTDEAEDFTQEVFLKAYSALGSFRRASSFSTWLTRIAYNTGINARKRKGRYESLDAEPEDARNISPEDSLLLSESVSELKKAMAELPERYALCLELYFREGMKYEEISQVSGMPVNTIKSHVFRAKQSLRQALQETGYENRG